MGASPCTCSSLARLQSGNWSRPGFSAFDRVRPVGFCLVFSSGDFQRKKKDMAVGENTFENLKKYFVKANQPAKKLTALHRLRLSVTGLLSAAKERQIPKNLRKS